MLMKAHGEVAVAQILFEELTLSMLD